MKLKQKLMTYLCAGAVLATGVIGGHLAENAVKKGAESVAASASAVVERPTVVLDAGHGGADVPEKRINLSIMLTTRDILSLLGYNVVCTRETDVSIHDAGIEGLRRQKISDMDNRLAVINGSGALLAVSIHQNQFTDPQYHGAQMFYRADSDESLRLAETLKERFRNHLQPENERETKPVGDELFLIHNAQCPAVMAECGFLSNPEEAAKLESMSYQREVGFVIADGILKFLTEQ